MTLQLLRTDFDTRDHNRRILFSHIIPISFTLIILFFTIVLFGSFTKLPSTGIIFIGVIISFTGSIFLRMQIRKKLPDFVTRKDIEGTVNFSENELLISRTNAQPIKIKTNEIRAIEFIHNYSCETKLGYRDDKHNGLAVLRIEMSNNQRIECKCIIHKDEQLLFLIDYIETFPICKISPVGYINRLKRNNN